MTNDDTMTRDHTDSAGAAGDAHGIGEIRGIRGPVARLGDADYDPERTGFQAAYQHRPALIVGATGPADVRAAVAFAAGRELPIAVQATGHGLAVAAEGGVLINSRRMTKVRVDPVARTARVAAGVRWQRVIQEAARYGLAPLSGSAPDVGVVGYTLGGGLGLLSREYGYTADHVRAVEIVTADGEQRRVTAEEEPELFWALRGAGGNFGVVTALEIDLVPVTTLYGGGLYFAGELAPDVLVAWREWTAAAPEELTSGVGLIPYPDLPMVPEPLRGRYVAHVRIAYTGGAADGSRLVAPMRAVGPALIDTLGEMPYTESGAITADPTMPHGYYGTNAMLTELPPSLPASVLELTGPNSPVPCVVQLNHLGGALARPPSVPNAVAHRDASYLLRVLSVVEGAGPSAAHRAPGRLTDAMAPWTLGRSPNFVLGEPSTADAVRSSYHPDDYPRLARLKARYDPANLFRLNQNIPPA
jgi:FAD/FMN-containing dehydrogenase